MQKVIYMFDCHYDLLTYICMNKNDLRKVKKYCNKIFKSNITGGIFNLFYMSPAQMKNELNIDKNNINIIENLKEVNYLINKYNIIPKQIEYIKGIEGLDYLEKLEDIETIYNLGVRSVNPVWNNDNKFGGGIKGDKKRGLTDLGEELIKKLVEKNIGIDLSHTNEKTFFNIIEVCKGLKEKGKSPIVIASHSNAKQICNVERNLSDEQILKIKELDGIIGVVGVKCFCKKVKNTRMYFLGKYKKAYIEHIRYIKNLLGSVENIAVSTDDMTYYNTFYYKHFNVFKQSKIKKELEVELLRSGFSNIEIEKIMYKNIKEKILDKI